MTDIEVAPKLSRRKKGEGCWQDERKIQRASVLDYTTKTYKKVEAKKPPSTAVC